MYLKNRCFFKKNLRKCSRPNKHGPSLTFKPSTFLSAGPIVQLGPPRYGQDFDSHVEQVVDHGRRPGLSTPDPFDIKCWLFESNREATPGKSTWVITNIGNHNCRNNVLVKHVQFMPLIFFDMVFNNDKSQRWKYCRNFSRRLKFAMWSQHRSWVQKYLFTPSMHDDVCLFL